jgi:hypothetical protein
VTKDAVRLWPELLAILGIATVALLVSLFFGASFEDAAKTAGWVFCAVSVSVSFNSLLDGLSSRISRIEQRLNNIERELSDTPDFTARITRFNSIEDRLRNVERYLPKR